MGDDPDLTEEPEECVSPSVSSSVESTATVGKGCDTAALKRSGCGLNFGAVVEIGDEVAVSGGETRSSDGGGVILTLGDDTVRLPLRTELFLPPRLHEEAESDFEGGVLEPSEVPPLMTVVPPGVRGISMGERLVVRVPNLPPSAAVMGI